MQSWADSRVNSMLQASDMEGWRATQPLRRPVDFIRNPKSQTQTYGLESLFVLLVCVFSLF